MNRIPISFHSEAIDFNIATPSTIQTWLQNVVQQEDSTLRELTYIFCTDAYLHEMNVAYLDHDTYTDVITFQYADDVVHGDIFISVERTNENAQKFDSSPQRELYRVMVHGLLHLLGYQDKTTTQKEKMRAKEDAYLALLEG